jgi:hypothetical protein
MSLTDDFDGTVPAPSTLTVTTPGGSSVVIPIQGIEKLELPRRKVKVDKYTPLSGTWAGKEKVLLCSQETGQAKATLTYEIQHQLAMDSIVGVNGCTIVFVVADGLTLTATGGISECGTETLEDSKHITASLSIDMNAGWTAVDGTPPSPTTSTTVPAYLVSMTSGAVTIDLTACGSAGTTNLTGKKLTRVTLSAPATNANAVTVVTGASNGYIFASQTLAAGESITVNLTTAADTVGATKKTLDVTGTGAQGVTVAFVAA